VRNSVDDSSAPKSHVVITTLAKLHSFMNAGRSGAINLKSLKCLVIDEADVFFENNKDLDKVMFIH
jgi:superfamily II DNA/RNA helicase